MVIGGDTLFFADFKLTDVLRLFNEKGTNLVLQYPIEHDMDTLKTGVLELDDSGVVVNMLEKPHPSTTTSRKGCPCFYLYKRDTLQLLPVFIASAASLAEADAPGHFVSWVWSRSPMLRALCQRQIRHRRTADVHRLREGHSQQEEQTANEGANRWDGRGSGL